MLLIKIWSCYGDALPSSVIVKNGELHCRNNVEYFSA